jgi:hypothetical protein
MVKGEGTAFEAFREPEMTNWQVCEEVGLRKCRRSTTGVVGSPSIFFAAATWTLETFYIRSLAGQIPLFHGLRKMADARLRNHHSGGPRQKWWP